MTIKKSGVPYTSVKSTHTSDAPVHLNFHHFTFNQLCLFLYPHANSPSERLSQRLRFRDLRILQLYSLPQWLTHLERKHLRGREHHKWHIAPQCLCHSWTSFSVCLSKTILLRTHSQSCFACARRTSHQDRPARYSSFLNHLQNHTCSFSRLSLTDHAL